MIKEKLNGPKLTQGTPVTLKKETNTFKRKEEKKKEGKDKRHHL